MATVGARYSFAVLLSIAVYLNSYSGDFVFDDKEAILTNDDVNPRVTSWQQLFQHDFWGQNLSSRDSHKSYRPLTVLSYQFDFWLAGDRNPAYFHITNIGLHATVTLLYMILLEVFLVRLNAAYSHCVLLAGVIFAVHPIHTEAVAGLVGRAELISAALYILSLLSYIKCSSSSGGTNVFLLILSLILSVTAMLCKEQGITVLGICITFDFLQIKSVKLFHLMTRSIAVFVTALVSLWLRYVVMVTGPPKFHVMDNPATHASHVTTRVLTRSYIYSINGWLLLCPSWLCFDWSMGCIPLLEHVMDIRIMSVLLLWAGLLGLILLILFSNRLDASEKKLIAVGISLSVVPFLPATNILFPVGFVIAERVLYLPSTGYCLMIAAGFSKIIRHYKTIGWLLFAALLGVFVAKSVQRNGEWNNEESLFTSALTVCPLNAKVHYNIGKVKSDQGLIQEAEMEYRQAINLYPDYDQALNNLGNLLKETSRPKEALSVLTRAITVSPEFAAAWMNLGITQAHLGHYQEAELSYARATQLRHIYPDAYYNMGNMYIDMRKHQKAIKAFGKAISLKQDHYNAWNNLGLLYQELDQLEEAKNVFMTAISHMPLQSRLVFNLGVILGKQGHYKEAADELMKAIEMDPQCADYYGNLGVIYHLDKLYDRAELMYRKALSLNPDLIETRKNLQKLVRKSY